MQQTKTPKPPTPKPEPEAAPPTPKPEPEAAPFHVLLDLPAMPVRDDKHTPQNPTVTLSGPRRPAARTARDLLAALNADAVRTADGKVVENYAQLFVWLMEQVENGRQA